MRAAGPLLITLLIQAMSALALMAVPVLVPVAPGMPRLSTAGIGLFVLLAYLGAVIGSLSAGPLVERLGAVRTSQIGLLLSALGLALAAVIPAALFPNVMFPAALLVGLGYGPITPASSHILIRTTPAQRLNLVFSIKQTGVPLGVALSGFCVPPLALANGWAVTLAVLALACIAVAGGAQAIQRGLDAQTASAIPASWTARRLWASFLEPLAVIWQHPGLRTLAAVSFVLSGMQIAFTSYLVTFLTQELALTALVAGSLLGLSQTGGVIGRVVWGYLSDRLVHPLHMLALVCTGVAAAALATSSLAVLDYVPPPLVLAALMFFFGASVSGWNGVYLAEVARQAPPGAAGKATSGTLAVTFMGVIVGTPLFGLIATSRGGFSAAFGVHALLALVLAGVLFRLGGRRRGGVEISGK
jgi:MFS family permease